MLCENQYFLSATDQYLKKHVRCALQVLLPVCLLRVAHWQYTCLSAIAESRVRIPVPCKYCIAASAAAAVSAAVSAAATLAAVAAAAEAAEASAAEAEASAAAEAAKNKKSKKRFFF